MRTVIVTGLAITWSVPLLLGYALLARGMMWRVTDFIRDNGPPGQRHSTALSAAQVKTIEDYLLFKWIGLAPDGYGDFTGATISGAGDVEAAEWDDLPQLAPTFTGKVRLTGGSLAFTFDPALGSPVKNPIGTEGLSIALQDAVAVTIDFASNPDAGSFKLVHGTLVNADTVFTLSVTGMTGGSKMKLRAASDGLWLDVSKSGILILVH